MRNRIENLLNAQVTQTASTRAIALFRILLAMLVLQRYGPELSLYALETPWTFMLSTLFFVFTPLMLVGWMTRIAVPAVALMLGLLYYSQPLGAGVWMGMSHHQYVLFILTFLTAFAPSAGSFSVDRYLGVVRARRSGLAEPEERGTVWAQKLIVLQLCAIYFWTAIDKTHWEFVNGDRLERIFEWAYAASPLHEVLTPKPLLAFGSTMVLLVEYMLPVAILARWRLQLFVPVGLALHAMFYVMLPVNTYSASMMIVYLLVVRPSRVHDVIDTIIGQAGSRRPSRA